MDTQSGPPSTTDSEVGLNTQPTCLSIQTWNSRRLSAIEALPQEMLDSIVSDLEWRDITRLMRTCRLLSSRLVDGLYEDAFWWNMDLLVWACEKGQLELVRYLSNKFGTVNRLVPANLGTVYFECTALHVAVHWGFADIVFTLLNELGADVHIRDEEGRTALSYARTEEIVEILLNAGADARTSTDINYHGRPLLWQVMDPGQPRDLYPSVEAVRLLIEKGGADPNARHGTNNPLYAALRYDASMVETLLQLGANPDGNSDHYASTPLTVVASQPDRLQMVELLLDYGASVNNEDETRYNPLVEAVRGKAVETVKLLLASGADVNRCGRGNHYSSLGDIHSPLSMALFQQDWEIIEILLQAGAQINNERVSSCFDPVCVAASKLDIHMLEFLFKHRAKVSHSAYKIVIHKYCKQANRCTGWQWVVDEAEHCSLQKTCLAILDMLVEHGGNSGYPHLRADESDLFTATRNSDADLIQKVLSHGANINAKSQEYDRDEMRLQYQMRMCAKYTALHVAVLSDKGIKAEKATMQTIRCLLDSGANPLIGDAAGITPLAASILYRECGWWGTREWDMAQCLLEHKRGGPAITAEFSKGLLARFLSHAIVSLGDGKDLVERIVLFASLTNIKGRWGPDGLSELRYLTFCPEYWREPRLRNDGWYEPDDPAVARTKLIVASNTIAKLCRGGGKLDGTLITLIPVQTGQQSVRDTVDDDWSTSLDLLFGGQNSDDAATGY